MIEDKDRYVIEAKDEFGWFDYQFSMDVVAVIKEAKYLRESFPNLRVVDRLNQSVVWES